ncbi:MAG TPA: hypothetical protein VG983_01440 [Caulobacterales bacterium]|jgi:hypothetical protein|nr:hypothetical protein [Caulobacterales bacterium]
MPATASARARYKFREAAAFDFSNAPVYRKVAPLKASQIKIAARRREVVTHINGEEETRNVARPGDIIVTGVRGERYVMTPRHFKALYEKDPDRAGRYRAKTKVRALKLTENTELMAPWGEKQRARKGGVVVQRIGRPRDIYLIEAKAFRETYAPVESAKRAKRLTANKP